MLTLNRKTLSSGPAGLSIPSYFVNTFPVKTDTNKVYSHSQAYNVLLELSSTKNIVDFFWNNYINSKNITSDPVKLRHISVLKSLGPLGKSPATVRAFLIFSDQYNTFINEHNKYTERLNWSKTLPGKFLRKLQKLSSNVDFNIKNISDKEKDSLLSGIKNLLNRYEGFNCGKLSNDVDMLENDSGYVINKQTFHQTPVNYGTGNILGMVNSLESVTSFVGNRGGVNPSSLENLEDSIRGSSAHASSESAYPASPGSSTPAITMRPPDSPDYSSGSPGSPGSPGSTGSGSTGSKLFSDEGRRFSAIYNRRSYLPPISEGPQTPPPTHSIVGNQPYLTVEEAHSWAARNTASESDKELGAFADQAIVDNEMARMGSVTDGVNYAEFLGKQKTQEMKLQERRESLLSRADSENLVLNRANTQYSGFPESVNVGAPSQYRIESGVRDSNINDEFKYQMGTETDEQVNKLREKLRLKDEEKKEGFKIKDQGERNVKSGLKMNLNDQIVSLRKFLLKNYCYNIVNMRKLANNAKGWSMLFTDHTSTGVWNNKLYNSSIYRQQTVENKETPRVNLFLSKIRTYFNDKKVNSYKNHFCHFLLLTSCGFSVRVKNPSKFLSLFPLKHKDILGGIMITPVSKRYMFSKTQHAPSGLPDKLVLNGDNSLEVFIFGCGVTTDCTERDYPLARALFLAGILQASYHIGITKHGMFDGKNFLLCRVFRDELSDPSRGKQIDIDMAFNLLNLGFMPTFGTHNQHISHNTDKSLGSRAMPVPSYVCDDRSENNIMISMYPTQERMDSMLRTLKNVW